LAALGTDINYHVLEHYKTLACHNRTCPGLTINSTAPNVRKQQKQYDVVGQRQRNCRTPANNKASDIHHVMLQTWWWGVILKIEMSKVQFQVIALWTRCSFIHMPPSPSSIVCY